MMWFLMLAGCGMVTPLTTPTTPGDVDSDGVAAPQDCDDTNPLVRPGVPEICDDGFDNDCDGVTDDDGLGSITWYRDADRDGVGVTTETRMACSSFDVEGWSRQFGDCDDTLAWIYPGAPETCDGFDEDCDGGIDEDLEFVTWFLDADGDGFGNADIAETTCAPLGSQWSTDGRDCDDDDASINPGALDLCDGIDNDCTGLPDDQGVASFDGTLYPMLTTAIDAARPQSPAVVDICTGDFTLPQDYVFDSLTDDVTLRGQGSLATTLRVSVLGPPANLVEAFEVTNAARLSIEALSVRGPGFVATGDEGWRLADVTDGVFRLSDVEITDAPLIVRGAEQVGTDVDIIIELARLALNRQLVELEGEAYLELTDVDIEDNTPNDTALFVLSRTSAQPFAPRVDGLDVTVRNNTAFAQSESTVFHYLEDGPPSGGRLDLADTVFETNDRIRAFRARDAWIEGSNVRVEGSTGLSQGGAAYLVDSILREMTLQGNQAAEGGAVYMTGTLLEEVHIIGNSASTGGGIYVFGDEQSRVDSDCVLHQNTATNGHAAYLIGARFDSLFADFGDATSGTNNGTGSEVRVYNDDGFILNAFSAEADLWRCDPNEPCEFD